MIPTIVPVGGPKQVYCELSEMQPAIEFSLIIPAIFLRWRAELEALPQRTSLVRGVLREGIAFPLWQ